MQCLNRMNSESQEVTDGEEYEVEIKNYWFTVGMLEVRKWK